MTQAPGDNQHLEKTPPQAIEIEQAVLGAMILEQRAIVHAVEILDSSCFYNTTHSHIFEAIMSLFERGVAVDQLTLAEELKRRDQLYDVGGVVYLAKLAAKVATTANSDIHARVVIEKALSSRLIETASDIIEQAYKGPPSSVYLRWNAFSATYESFGPKQRNPMQLPLYQIDAFTGSAFKGNPAAVIPLKTWLDDGTLQAIATENNLPATAFFCPTKEEGVFDLRCFTPVIEVPLCGHATLASAFVLMTEIDRDLDYIEFETRSGCLEVWGDYDIYTMDFPAMNLRPTDRPEQIIAAIGAAPTTVLRSNNWLFWLLVYDSEDEVAELDVDVSELASALAEADAYAGVICTAPAGDRRADFVSRYFAPCHGIPEDSVTGSAHCSLVPYWSERLGRPDRELHALQISARGGELFCRDRGNRVEITGRAVKYMEGTVFL